VLVPGHAESSLAVAWCWTNLPVSALVVAGDSGCRVLAFLWPCVRGKFWVTLVSELDAEVNVVSGEDRGESM